MKEELKIKDWVCLKVPNNYLRDSERIDCINTRGDTISMYSGNNAQIRNEYKQFVVKKFNQLPQPPDVLKTNLIHINQE